MINLAKKVARTILPAMVKKALKNIEFRYTYRRVLGDAYFCPVCGNGVNGFLPLDGICDGKFVRDTNVRGERYPVSDYETLNVKKFLCPVCGAQDKARLYALYLRKELEKRCAGHSARISLVHFAPEGGLSDLIRQYDFINYITADLYRTDVDHKVDITNMGRYQSGSIDLFICSHVLEHIQDDDLALSELSRILADDGWGILMVPVLLPLDATYEDSTINTDEGRLDAFGLEDHVRVYAKKDFINKLKRAGFVVSEYEKNYFGEREFARCGIAEKSVLYVVRKR